MRHTSARSSGRKDGVRVHIVTHHPEPLVYLRKRCRQSPAFRKLLEVAGYAVIRRGKSNPKLSANTPEVLQALEVAVEAFSQSHRAALPQGVAAAWRYLTPKRRRVKGRVYRTLTEVSKAEALCILHAEATLDGFKVRKVLGYSATISWRAAAKLNRVHAPPFFYLVPQDETPVDKVWNLDMNENEHFRDDRGEYDDAGKLQPYNCKERDSWEAGYASRNEAWNQAHIKHYRVPTPVYFYPACPALPVKRLERKTWRIDHHGVAETLRQREDKQRCQRDLARLHARQTARVLPDAPLYHADLNRSAQALLEREHIVTLGRRAELDADAFEVSAHADTDVPETICHLLEQQVEEVTGKAPRGLIAALADARLQSQKYTRHNQQYVQGLATLEVASQRIRV